MKNSVEVGVTVDERIADGYYYAKTMRLIKKIYREIEELGDYKTQKGQELKQVRVYYGSHTYNTEEMKNLLEGTLSEMAELGIKPRLSKEDKERYGL